MMLIKDDYLRISIGNIHLSNADINQYIEINLFVRNGLVIIFCSSKIKCENLSRDLNDINIPSGCIHGDKLQNIRQEIVDKLKLNYK